ncbi:MAG TPA: MFS transporter [Candidatus Limnocylindrales bacterium]|jgi:DHA1 family multidrug resistance protein-like MFS transporter
MSGWAGSLAARAASVGRGLDRSLALLAAIAFIAQTGVAVMLPLLPLYATQLGASPSVLGILTSAFAITNAAAQLAAGFLVERFGTRRLVPSGMSVYAAGNALIATATAAVPLIAWRSMAGFGAGISLVAERLYLSQVIDRARLAFANGLLSAAGSAGSVAGPVLGGFLAETDLRLPFVLVAVTSALAATAAWFLPRPRPGGPDTATPAAGNPTPRIDRRALAILLAANVGLLAGFGSFITTYGAFAEGVLLWSRREVGLVFALFGLGSIVLGPWLGHQADRRGRRLIAILSCVPVVLFVLALVAALPRPVIYISAVASGGGIAGFQAAWYALLVGATGGVRGGRAFGIVSAFSTLGIVIGATSAAALWEAVDIHLGVAVTAVVVVFAAVAMAVFREPRPDAPAPTLA